MSTHITGKFKYTSWDENAYEEELSSGRRLTRASVVQDPSGDIEGEGSAEWLMCLRPDKTATFVGLQRVTGTIGERSGSFVVESHGTFDGELARGRWTVVPGSGTDDLRDIRGKGSWEAPHGPEATFELDYDLG
jgi:Protein of unknown function (DUF3224)